MSDQSSSALRYRPDIDGLRTIAVGSVVLYHAFPKILPGGFIGVDIFFVISGFLISSIIFGQVEKGTFSFADFYARRIRRIFPALLIVLLATLAGGWLVLLPTDWAQLGKHGLGSLFFVQNMVLRAEVGYFDQAADLKPLLHLWSLAVEEQFYLLWPLVAVLGLRFRRAFPALLGLALLALLLQNLLRNNETLFFSFKARIWELLVGVALAYMHHHRASLPGRFLLSLPQRPVLGGLLSLSGALLLGIGLATLSPAPPYPAGPGSLFPVFGAALIIAAGPGAWFNRAVLSLRPMIWVGLISYPLYLWHWPLLSLPRWVVPDTLPTSLRLGLVIASVILATLTYRWVERPLRHGASPRRPAALLAAAGGVVAALSTLIWYDRVPPLADRYGITAINRAITDWEFPGPAFRETTYRNRTVFVSRAATGPEHVLFIGDSNVEQYSPRVSRLLDTPDLARRFTVSFMTGGGCPAIPGVSEKDHPDCATLTDTALAYIRENRVNRVVLAGLWLPYFTSATYRVGDDPLATPAGRDRALASLQTLVRTLTAEGRHVTILLTIPYAPDRLDPRAMYKRTFPHFLIDTSPAPRDALQPQVALAQRMRDALSGDGVTLIDPMDALCSPDGSCPAVQADGTPLYKDGAHLRAGFVREHATFIDPIFSDR